MRHLLKLTRKPLLRGNEFQYFSRSLSTSRQLNIPTLNAEELIVPSQFPDLTFPQGVTVPEFLRSTMGSWGDQTAFECGFTGRKYTHNQVYSMGRSFGASLIQAGFKKGDCIAVVLPNVPEFASVIFGIWEAGLIPTTVNPSYTAAEMQRQFKVAEVKATVTIENFLPLIQNTQSSGECPDLKSVILIGGSREGCHSFFEMVKTDANSVTFPVLSEAEIRENTCFLPFSSGTTGVPKGVCLTQQNILFNLIQFTIPGMTHLPRRVGNEYIEKLIGLLPFFHLYGMAALINLSLYRGAHTLCLPKFEPKSFLDAVRRHQPTVLHLVAPIIAQMVHSAEFREKELESVQVIWSGAASTGPVLANRLLEKANKYILFREGYGMTEMSGASHMTPPHAKNMKIGSCGLSLPNTLTRIVDVTTGHNLGRNQPGEIWVKGPQVMKGYHKNEEATKSTLDSNGWLRTGDVGYLDDQGFLYIVDRIKELIKVKGFQVSPSELEDILRQHTLIADVGVIGVANEDWGEVPRAYIVRKDVSLGAEEVNSYLQEQVAYYKQLRGGIEFVNEIPKAPTGKILRRVLSEKYKSQAK